MTNPILKLIKHDREPSESVITLLENTLIGTEGTLYQLLDTATKIHLLQHPHFFSIYRNEKAIANITICERHIQLPEGIEKALYIRYLAFSTIFQASGKKSKLNSRFHQFFKDLFKTSNLDTIHPEFDKKLYWAYIDPQNLRSFNLNESFGFETIGQFQTFAFSRINPKNTSVEKLEATQKPGVLIALKDFYKDYVLFSDAHLFEQDNYYVLKVNGEIICGIQANPVHWKIKSLPGLKGKLLVRFASYIPRINKLINPKNHRFLATEGLFWKPGFEKYVPELLEGVLAKTNHHSLLIWSDISVKTIDALNINWGFIQKNKKNNPIHIVARLNGYSAAEVAIIKDSPKYLSGFDMT